MLAGLLRRLADQPGERDERSGCEHEQRDVTGAEQARRNRDGREHKGSPQEPARHAVSLTACCGQFCSTGVTR